MPASSNIGGAHSDLAVHIADWQRQQNAYEDAQRPGRRAQRPRAISAAAQEMLQNWEATQRVRWPFNHLGDARRDDTSQKDETDRQAESTATQQEMPAMPNVLIALQRAAATRQDSASYRHEVTHSPRLKQSRLIIERDEGACQMQSTSSQGDVLRYRPVRNQPTAPPATAGAAVAEEQQQ